MDQEIVYEKLPADIAERFVLVMDPILGTGGSAARAVKVGGCLAGRGVRGQGGEAQPKWRGCPLGLAPARRARAVAVFAALAAGYGLLPLHNVVAGQASLHEQAQGRGVEECRPPPVPPLCAGCRCRRRLCCPSPLTYPVCRCCWTRVWMRARFCSLGAA